MPSRADLVKSHQQTQYQSCATHHEHHCRGVTQRCTVDFKHFMHVNGWKTRPDIERVVEELREHLLAVCLAFHDKVMIQLLVEYHVVDTKRNTNTTDRTH